MGTFCIKIFSSIYCKDTGNLAMQIYKIQKVESESMIGQLPAVVLTES